MCEGARYHETARREGMEKGAWDAEGQGSRTVIKVV